MMKRIMAALLAAALMLTAMPMSAAAADESAAEKRVKRLAQKIIEQREKGGDPFDFVDR